MKKLQAVCVYSAMLIGTLTYADIYKWVDVSGVVHYSDTPHSGAQRIENPAIETAKDPAPIPKGSSTEQTIESANAHKKYTGVAITQPSDKATIRNNQGYVLVNVEPEPALQEGDLLQIIFDGNPFGVPQTNLSFAFSNINRGTHKVAVQILDKNAQMILISKTIEFYMQRPRVNMGGVKA